MGRYRYFLSIQTVLPEDYRTSAEFARNLETLQRLGFDGVELNMRDPGAVDPQALAAYLARFGLGLAMFASGLTAKTFNLSLCSADEGRRQESLRRCREFLEFAQTFGAGVIAGYLKGGVSDGAPGAAERLQASVAELAPLADRLRTPLLVEAVNRYEAPVGRSLAETCALIRGAGSPYVQILPDTFHMNIEEADMESAMTACREHYSSFHLSDNTRHFPGLGAIDFARVAGILERIGYQGKVAIEGNLRGSFVEDVEASMRLLGPILTRR
jgi:D-psicose/D-tagatose/L-ribulose 3-epimerase